MERKEKKRNGMRGACVSASEFRDKGKRARKGKGGQAPIATHLQKGILAVHWEEVLGIDHLDNLLLFFLVGVAGRVQRILPSHRDAAPPTGQAVHHAHHSTLIPWDHLGTVKHKIVPLDLEQRVCTERRHRERSAGLRLRACVRACVDARGCGCESALSAKQDSIRRRVRDGKKGMG